MKLERINLIPSIICFLAIAIVVYASNSQGDGRSYFNVDQASVNISGEGYNEDGLGTPFNYDGTGFFRQEFPAFCTVESVYTNDGIWFRINWTNGSGSGSTTVVTVEPLTGDGTSTAPIDINIGTGFTVTGGALTLSANTDDIPEGSSHKYFSDAQVDTWVGLTYQIDQAGGTGGTYGVMTGVPNGALQDFTLSNTPASAAMVMVLLNGAVQIPDGDDYTLTVDALHFTIAPAMGDVILVMYWKPSSISP
jgi:hypothetical protein